MAIQDGRSHSAGLILLFRKEDRPAASDVRAAVSGIARTSISFDPDLGHGDQVPNWLVDANAGAADSGISGGTGWLELLVDGLTFDMVGLAPGPSVTVPDAEFRVDCAPDLDPGDYAMVGLAPGPHLVGGMRSLVVAKALVTLGSRIAEQLGTAEAFIWLPSRCITGAKFFCSTVAAWDNGGPFPALGLTAFRADSDGALVSSGMSFFTGQELRLPPEMVSDPAAATRLAIRLVHQLVMHGPLNASELITAPDGSGLILEPSEDGNLVIARSA